MAIVWGPNQYGKAEVRLVHVDRSTPVHKIKDVNVTSQLIGDFAATHATGDNSAVIATDTQKNTVYALARQGGVGAIEDFALRMARNFVDKYEQVSGARQAVEEYFWERITTADGAPHDHSFVKGSPEVRTTIVTKDGADETVISRIAERHGAQEHRQRVPRIPRGRVHVPRRDHGPDHGDGRHRALALRGYGRRLGQGVRQRPVDHAGHVRGRAQPVAAADALRHGRGVLEAHPEIAEMRLSMPNKHHFLVDMSKWGLDNPTRSGTPPTGHTASSRPRSSVTTSRPPEAWLGVKGFI